MGLLKYLQNAHTFHFTQKTLTNLMEKVGFNSLASDEYVHSLFETSKSVSEPILIPEPIIDELIKIEKIRPLFEIKKEIFYRLKKIRHFIYKILNVKTSAEKKLIK